MNTLKINILWSECCALQSQQGVVFDSFQTANKALCMAATNDPDGGSYKTAFQVTYGADSTYQGRLDLPAGKTKAQGIDLMQHMVDYCRHILDMEPSSWIAEKELAAMKINATEWLAHLSNIASHEAKMRGIN
jgi:hypothetical protein